MARIDHEIDWNTAMLRAVASKRIRYGAMTPWWADDDARWYTNKVGLPCDPRGGLLFETDNPRGFMESAKANETFYGKHGLRAFLLAHHGCVVADNGNPTCLKSWAEYNALIDAHDAERARPPEGVTP